MNFFWITLLYLLQIIYAQLCETITNSTTVSGCGKYSTDSTICCLGENLVTKAKQCLQFEDNSFIQNSVQIRNINNVNYNITCPELNNEKKCKYYKNPNNYTTCAQFSLEESLCCLAKLNVTNNPYSCYWESNVTASYGLDSVFYQNYTVDIMWAIQNNIPILQLNKYDCIANVSGIKTCYGLELDSQKNCSNTQPTNSTNCAWANTKDNICCLLHIDNKNDKCIWVPDTSKICYVTSIMFNNINYTRDCTFSSAKYIGQQWIIFLMVIFLVLN